MNDQTSPALTTGNKRPFVSVRLTLSVLILGLILTFLSLAAGQKSAYPNCDFTGNNLHQVDRGFPLRYFRVTPSASDCKPVEEVSAIFKSDVGNEISPAALIGDLAVWSALSTIIIVGVRRAIGKPRTTK